MSKVYIRDKENLLWIPISAGAGAVPNKVNAVLAGAFPQPWKSICGLTDPPAGQKRKIRNLANNAWIDLDEFSVINPPVQVGAVVYQGTSGTSINIRPATGAVAGDLIVGFIHSAAATATFSDNAATVLTQTSGSNLNLCIAWAIHDGVTVNYRVNISASAYCEAMSVTIRGAGAAPACLNASVYRSVVSALAVRDHPTTQNAITSYMSFFHVVDTQANGDPYVDNDPNWAIAYSNLGTTNNYNQMVCSLTGMNIGAIPNPSIDAEASGTRWKGVKLRVDA
jgi:hypothetical protein